MAGEPLAFRFDGEDMVPLSRAMARARFETGRVYVLEASDQRSWQAEKHYQACLQKGWGTLPEHWREKFANPEQMREYVLIREGFSNCRLIALTCPEQASAVAAHAQAIAPMALVVISDDVVAVHTAKSQDRATMGAEEWVRSKRLVLEWVAAAIGVTVDQLSANAA